MSLLHSKNFWAGMVMLLLGLAVILLLIPIGVDEPRRVKYAALSPSYYPRIVAICLSLLGLVITVRSALAPTTETTDGVENRPDAFQRIAVVFGTLFSMALVLTTLGFIVTTALALAAAIWFAGERNYILIVSMAIIIPLALYFFFLKVAGIPIPLGVLHPLLAGV
ncbi:MAG: tripartite tricarboxylate transporter TctB family protein [Pseudomonadota bacterium]